MQPANAALLVVDMQVRLLGVVPSAVRITWNCRRLMDGAQVFAIPLAATEQNPAKLGATVAELTERLWGPPPAKLAFSCGERGEIFNEWHAAGRNRVLVCGIETHVCVQQTVLDLLAAGYMPFVAADAVGARSAIDHDIALRRMENAGAVITTTESALFEWCGVAGTDQFRQISALAKESPPA
jgi:nicotinamidase-related amidase